MTTRSGRRKSSIAAPCFRNSGLLTTLKGCVVSRRITSRTRSDVRNGHRALVDDDLVAVHRTANLSRRLQDMLKIGRAVLAHRRTDGDEQHLTLLDGLREIGREGEPFFGAIATDEFFETRLVDRDLAAPEQRC